MFDHYTSHIPASTLHKLSLWQEEKQRGYTLNSEQLDVLYAALNRRSLFLTGGAGTGKSFLLERIIARLRERFKNVGVTASTGVAACRISGTTLHSFTRIGLGKRSVKDYIHQF